MRIWALSQPIERSSVSGQLDRCLAADSHTVLIAETSGGGLIGFVAVHWLPYLCMRGPEGFISELFIAESARGQGSGTRLLDAVVALARERGCSRLHLMNHRSRESYQRDFYRKTGWIERAEAADFV
ncbi:MAG TPA: GNAT family N-acetyltransferase, partial [Herpetosiphonaceae bacterium]|nr:GNAT family N-acetyltransferase [Herpetosiphonaceae bacterium]